MLGYSFALHTTCIIDTDMQVAVRYRPSKRRRTAKRAIRGEPWGIQSSIQHRIDSALLHGPSSHHIVHQAMYTQMMVKDCDASYP